MHTMSALVTMCFASPVGTCITRFIKRSHFQLLALYDSHTLSALQLCFRKPSRYMHHEIYQTQSLSVTCSLWFAYPVGTATMFSQAQSVHASRDLSYAVTFSYLLSMIRIPCRHLHLKVLQAQSVHASKIFRKPMQSVHASRDYQTQPLFTCISMFCIPCVWFAYHVGTASI